MLASFDELCRLIAVAARMNAPPNRPFGRVFDNWRFLINRSPLFGAHDDLVCLLKRLFINSASKKIFATGVICLLPPPRSSYAPKGKSAFGLAKVARQ
jgi:hypothetical protein